MKKAKDGKRKERWSDFTEKDIDKIIYERCTHCGYRGMLDGRICCDYIIHTGNSRGCRPDECDKFFQGNRRKICVRPGNPPNSKKVVPYVRRRKSTKPAATYFGLMIEDYMAINKMLQRDFAEKVGVKEDAVSRWRAGKHFPGKSTIIRICKVTGIPEERIRDEIKKGML